MFAIAGRAIGPEHRPYLIAELSANHNGDLQRAFAIVDAAAKAGADAVKLQTYTADTMTLDLDAPGFVIDNPATPWHGQQLYKLYQEAYTPWQWHQPIMERAAKHGLHCFSTPFDESAVDFLETLNVPAYKIASFELTDLPLIRKVSATGKPMIMSTGMASLAEIGEAVAMARQSGCKDLLLLKCTSTYPATPQNTNLRTIPNLRDAAGCLVGLSDHTMGCGAAVAAVAFGAVLIEKHFILRRSDGGPDSSFSLEPEEFALLRVETERAWQSLGNVTYGGTRAEQASKIWRRSLVVGKDMRAGDVFDKDTLRIVRPAIGLPPKYYDDFIGKKVARDLAKGTPVTWDILAGATSKYRE